MTRIRWTDNASRRPWLESLPYTICSRFAICSFLEWAIITLTKHIQDIASVPHPESDAGAPDEVLTIRHSDLVEGMVAELLDYFSDARVTGVRLLELQARLLAVGGIERALHPSSDHKSY